MMHRLLTAVVAVVALVAGPLAVPSAAQTGFESRASAAYVIDVTSGTVLLDVNSDIPLPPASMSKLMTLTMLFEAIEDGRLSLDTTFTVSERAHAMGGSRMFLETRHRPTAEDLIRGIAVLSGNDATVVVAEGLAGTEEAFATMATRRARDLGMENTTIANASGWPHPEHRMSMRDLAILAEHMITEFPQFYPYLAEAEFTWNNITQSNRVPLLGAGVGLDGLKTGFTSEAGYSLTGSALQGDRRIIFAFSGLGSERERVEEAERIINWAFRQFASVTVARSGQVLAEADVWMGEAARVPLTLAEDLRILIPSIAQRNIEARAVFDAPLPAPVQAGQRVGDLVISVPDMEDRRVPLIAAAAVPEGGFMVRMQAAAQVLLREIQGARDGDATALQ